MNISDIHRNNISGNPFLTKLNYLTDLDHDFIFLCDTRLGREGTIAIKKALALTHNGNFEIATNSLIDGSRGVAILYKASINLEIKNTYRDLNSNVLGLDLILNGMPLLLMSVYGPNIECNEFLTDINNIIDRVDHSNYIMGGGIGTQF